MSDAAQVTATPVLHNGFTIPQGIVPRETLVLAPEEKIQLKVLLNNPVFMKAMQFAQLQKPSAFFKGKVDAEDKADRLSEIRGWEAMISSLCLQAQTEVYDFKKHKEVGYGWTETPGYQTRD